MDAHSEPSNGSDYISLRKSQSTRALTPTTKENPLWKELIAKDYNTLKAKLIELGGEPAKDDDIQSLAFKVYYFMTKVKPNCFFLIFFIFIFIFIFFYLCCI